MSVPDEGDPKQKPKPDPDKREPDSSPEEALRKLARAFKLFLFPFLFSWALAYVGSARGLEWLYFTGLGGVTLSMVVLLVWLIS